MKGIQTKKPNYESSEKGVTKHTGQTYNFYSLFANNLLYFLYFCITLHA